MSTTSILILGGGFSGLLTGALLSKEGYDVTIIEKNEQVGGSLQIFKRDGVFLDTGVHYVGSLGKGEVLHDILKYVSALDRVELEMLDPDGFDKVHFHSGKQFSFSIPNELGKYCDRLIEYFPKEVKAVNSYRNMLIEVERDTPLFNLRFANEYSLSKWRTVSLDHFLNSITENQNLKNVLLGNNLLYAAHKQVSSVYTHALVMLSFLQSAFRIKYGSHQIAKNLMKEIKTNGGKIIRLESVVNINVEESNIVSVDTDTGESYGADLYISSIGLKQTFSKLRNANLRQSYLHRYVNSKSGISAFTLHALIDLPFRQQSNFNNYHSFDDNVWTGEHHKSSLWPNNFLEYSHPSKSSNQRVISVMASMSFDECKKWQNTYHTNFNGSIRDEIYLEWKALQESKIVKALIGIYPEIENHIKHVYSSSPLTYRDYLCTDEGSMYGLLKPFDGSGIDSFKTKFNNLYVTGQDLNMHGLYGVALTSIQLVGYLSGEEELFKKIRN